MLARSECHRGPPVKSERPEAAFTQANRVIPECQLRSHGAAFSGQRCAASGAVFILSGCDTRYVPVEAGASCRSRIAKT